MEGSLNELANYRLERAKEMLLAAEENLRIGQYKTSLNRSYYAIFHAIRAVNVLDGFDASKHSSVIAHFNQYHVHTGEFDKGTYKIIDSAYRIREKCDYSDFFLVSKEEAVEQYEKAAAFLQCVKQYMRDK